MNRLKISESIATISSLCCMAIVLGIFLPFAKVEIWGYDLTKISIFQLFTDSDIKELMSYTGADGGMLKTMIIFGISFIACVISSVDFKNDVSIVPTIIMVIAALVGKYIVDDFTDTVFHFGVVKELIGSTLLTWGYRALLWDSIAALAFNFYLNYLVGNSYSLSGLKNIVNGTGQIINTTIVCNKCGKKNNAGAKFCDGCGNVLQNSEPKVTQTTWFCSKCGTENSANSRFCDKCGNSK